MPDMTYVKRLLCQTCGVIYCRSVGQTSRERDTRSVDGGDGLTFSSIKEAQTYLESSAISSWWIFCLSMSSKGRYLDISFSIKTVLQYCLWTRYCREKQKITILGRSRSTDSRQKNTLKDMNHLPQTVLLYRVDTWGYGPDISQDTEDRMCDHTASSPAHRTVWMGNAAPLKPWRHN